MWPYLHLPGVTVKRSLATFVIVCTTTLLKMNDFVQFTISYNSNKFKKNTKIQKEKCTLNNTLENATIFIYKNTQLQSNGLVNQKRNHPCLTSILTKVYT